MSLSPLFLYRAHVLWKLLSEPFSRAFYRKPKLTLRTNQKSQSESPEAGWGPVQGDSGLGWYSSSTPQGHFTAGFHFLQNSIYSSSKQNNLLKGMTHVYNNTNLKCASRWCLESFSEGRVSSIILFQIRHSGMKLSISTYPAHFPHQNWAEAKQHVHLCPKSAHPKWPPNRLELTVTLERHFWRERGAVCHTYYPRFRLESNRLFVHFFCPRRSRSQIFFPLVSN